MGLTFAWLATICSPFPSLARFGSFRYIHIQIQAHSSVIHRAARMSILCSIIRLIPYMMKMRIYAYMSVVLFGLMWTALVTLKLAICETNDAWKNLPGVQCVLGPSVAGLELASTSSMPSCFRSTCLNIHMQRTSLPTSSLFLCPSVCSGASSSLLLGAPSSRVSFRPVSLLP